MDKFIVIDGLDGAGKDTQVKLLAEMYEKQGKMLLYVHIRLWIINMV